MIPQDMAPEQIVVALECLSKYSKAIKWAYYGACSLIPKKFEKLVATLPRSSTVTLGSAVVTAGSCLRARNALAGAEKRGNGCCCSILKGNPNATSLDLTKSALSSQVSAAMCVRPCCSASETDSACQRGAAARERSRWRRG
eukprot:3760073-Rhodomonas_salina.2